MADRILTQALCFCGRPERHRGSHMRSIASRLWEKVDKLGPIHPGLGTRCWIWTGATTQHGYGCFVVRAKKMAAHRVAWTLHVGPIPEGMKALHKCDNPPCVNYADHLFLGTMKDNTADMIAKGRGRMDYQSKKTHCVNGHEFTQENINLYTFTRKGKVVVTRRCRACARELARRYSARHRHASCPHEQ